MEKLAGLAENSCSLSSRISLYPPDWIPVQYALPWHCHPVCQEGSQCVALWYSSARQGTPNPPFIPPLWPGSHPFSVNAVILCTEREVNQGTRALHFGPADDYFLELDLSILTFQFFFFSTCIQESLNESMQISCCTLLKVLRKM